MNNNERKAKAEEQANTPCIINGAVETKVNDENAVGVAKRLFSIYMQSTTAVEGSLNVKLGWNDIPEDIQGAWVAAASDAIILISQQVVGYISSKEEVFEIFKDGQKCRKMLVDMNKKS